MSPGKSLELWLARGNIPKIAPTSTGLVYDGLGGHMRLYHTNVGYTIWLFNIAMENPQNK